MTKTIRPLAALVLTATLGLTAPTLLGQPAAADDLSCGYTAMTSPSTPIPDNGVATSSMNQVGMGTNDPLVDLDVIVNITHTFVGDLEVQLEYDGHTVLLANRVGSSGDNFSGTRFNDGAATHISSGTAPFTGSFRPAQSLNAMDDLSPDGVWTLRVTDRAGGDFGTITSWGLVMRTRWCDDVDRDTVKGSYDSCPFVKGVAPSGCPVRTRSVSISYNRTAKEFRGLLKCTAAPRCADAQPVRIYKVTSGPDALLSRAHTDAAGNYAIPRASVNGRYYAVAPRVFEEGVAECRRAQSANLSL